MCFVRCLVCLSKVEKTRKRNSSRQEMRKGVTTCLHLYIPKSFPSYDHVRWRKHLNYQGQQHGEISPFPSVNHQTLPGKRSGGGGGNRVVREKIANGMDWFARARNGASPSRASKQQHITTRGGNATSRECCSQILKKEVIREVGKVAFPSCRAEDCVLEWKAVGRSEYIP